jgi:hypothetical protein
MTPHTQHITNKRQEERQEPFDLGKLAAPALQLGLEFHSFGPRAQIIKALFLEKPGIFEGTNVANGTNLPSVKNAFLAMVVDERMGLKAA